MPKKWVEQARGVAPAQDFFLPQLCRPQALLALVLLAELLVLLSALSQPLHAGFDWVGFGLDSLFVQWLTLLSAAILCALRSWFARWHQGLAGIYCCALIVALTLACTAAMDSLLPRSETAGEAQTSRYLRHGLMSLIISALLMRYFYLQSRWRRQEQAELRARIEALQARIKPHLLFNTLNSIAGLVTSDPGKAERAVLDLSDLLRASLAKPGSLVLWKEEVELAKRYLSIEQYRLGKRLQLDWRINTIPMIHPFHS